MTLFFSLVFILCATYWPLSVGWLVVPGLLFLFTQQRSWESLVFWSSFLCYGHLWWVALLAYRHMQAPLSGAIILYLLLTSWFALLSILFWRVNLPLLRRGGRIALLPLLCGYFLVVSYATPFLSGIKGYPFLNPVLPLIAWLQPGEKILPHQWYSLNNQHYYYLPAPKRSSSRAGCAQQLMMGLNQIGPPPPGGNPIILSPESTFSYPLNEYSEELAWWRSVLPERMTWLFGAIWQNKEIKQQAALFLTKEPIINKHIKHNCIDFFESTNKTTKLPHMLNKLIGWKTEYLQAARTQGPQINLNGRVVQVLLCSEGLYAPLHSQAIILANETWFIRWVQTLFWAALLWRAWRVGCHAIIVTYKRILHFPSSLAHSRLLLPCCTHIT